ncbi:hypothetical protein GCM10014719_58800 [Planomonospora parontospora subsp. antibiotica]|nr:hypothetical protein GCM10014719_58800 [Planomonospora parontospora subsp. antibiotica]GII19316.1 hypothetical protein Ppa05_60420 [Planomonospora parontospora subsp. antibiotica]
MAVFMSGGTPVCWGNSYTTSMDATRVADCTVNDRDLAAALYVVPPYRPQDADANAAALAAFCDGLGAHFGTARRGLVLGEIKEISVTAYGRQIKLCHLRTPLYLRSELMERIRASYRPVFSAAAGTRARQVVLAAVERTPKGALKVVDMAAMLTTAAYVPVESSHELRMAEALDAARRCYLKPLRYGGQEVFPDFVLTDVAPRVYVEVYGVRGRESYEVRKRVKQEHYRTAGVNVIEWEVAEPLPDLSRR